VQSAKASRLAQIEHKHEQAVQSAGLRYAKAPVKPGDRGEGAEGWGGVDAFPGTRFLVSSIAARIATSPRR